MFRTLASTSALAVAVAFAQPALAQDAGPYFNGPYVSVAGGLDTQASDSRRLRFDTDLDGTYGDVVRTAAGANAFGPGFCSGTAVGSTAAAGCSSDDDEIGYAVRAGFDFRQPDSPLVAGLLVEASGSNAVDYSSGFSTTPASYTFSRELDYSIALRSRAGISPGDGRGLFYITGGVAYARINHDFVTTNTANSFTVVNDDDMRFGVQAGAGAELMITPSIGIGLEYLYSRYDDDKAYVAVGKGTAGATNPFLLVNSTGTNLRPSRTDLDLQSFRGTVSFHF
ncbi:MULTISPECIES: outer membrane beta-barrel protein [Bacteria]|uniref:outer membrane protein n=1 Tax=Bacteria TaxID=2 RepID=UPI001039F5AE|nr:MULTISPECIES: outer membrane beta-barrel protein [Bacteria]QDM39693.1 porin family protein [Altererythrobacter sp. TH136]TCJ39446.1 porin family protein [Parafrankia sp. BMG5.11]